MSSRRAFTLVELLVVIGIIATLIAILLPTVRGARDRATSVDCSSRLRELYLAQTQYAFNNRGKFAGISSAGDDRWERLLAPYVTKRDDGNSPVFQCPAFDGMPNPKSLSSYGLNSFIMMSNWRMRRDAKHASSNIVLFSDKSLQADSYVMTDDGYFLVMPSDTGLLCHSVGHTPFAAYRHSKRSRTNAVMADGHVQTFELNGLKRDSGHWYWGDLDDLRPLLVDMGSCCN